MNEFYNKVSQISESLISKYEFNMPLKKNTHLVSETYNTLTVSTAGVKTPNKGVSCIWH